jgi:adenosylcobinamide-phosphate synthase
VIAAAHFWLLLPALVLDWLVGDPDWLWRRVPHPVAAVGGLIGLLDRVLNRDALGDGLRRALGIVTIVVVAGIAGAIGWLLESVFLALPFGWIATIVLAAILLAARSLYDHVAAVAHAFLYEDIEAARKAVSRIVGRDPASLDEARICRAAIESTAENFSDGVVAPAFWFAIFGLPGLFAYKAINTADSMIGHLTDHHRAFGWAAARLDDLVNLPASRLAGFFLALAAPAIGSSAGEALRTMTRDAGKHRSPNAGWPEAAMAAALGLALAGPRRYAGIIVNDPFVNATGRREARPDDIRNALRVYVFANVGLFVLVAVLSLVLWWI